jgi:hypothetical protein
MQNVTHDSSEGAHGSDILGGMQPACSHPRRAIGRRRGWVLVLGGVGVVVLACGEEPRPEGGSGGSTSTTVGTTASTTSSATAGVVDGTSTTSEGGDEVGFLSHPDLSAAFECDPFEQACPPGRKCMPYALDGGTTWNATRCVRVMSDPRGKGESCTTAVHPMSGMDDCDEGLICWAVNAQTLEGTCAAFCIGTHSNPTCADPCERCPITGNGGLVCRSQCDPVAQSCPPGQACYPVYDEFQCAPDLSPVHATVGTACEYINVCPVGMACIVGPNVPGCASLGCCAPYCPVGDVDPCPELLPGTTCVPWFDGSGHGPPAECIVAPPGVCMQ